jgi:hypothetical protein
MLLRRETLSAIAAIEHLVGLQSQAPAPPYVGLWTRLEGFQAEELVRLMTDRSVVRIALMRGTIHLVSAADALAIRRVVQPALSRDFRLSVFGAQLAGVDLPKLVKVGRRLLADGALTPKDLGQRLQTSWPDRDAASLAYAVRCHTPLVQTPPRGLWGQSGAAAHTTAEAWLGRPLATNSRPDALILRYLRAFGPATVQDVQAWSGLTRLQPSLERLRLRLRRFRADDGAVLLDVRDAPLPDPDTPTPVRFLPDFDNVLLAHADRTRIISDADRKQVFTKNGLVRPAVLVDGFVRGLWKVASKGSAATLSIELFGAIPRQDAADLEREGGRLLAFTAPGLRHDIHIRPFGSMAREPDVTDESWRP